MTQRASPRRVRSWPPCSIEGQRRRRATAGLPLALVSLVALLALPSSMATPVGGGAIGASWAPPFRSAATTTPVIQWGASGCGSTLNASRGPTFWLAGGIGKVGVNASLDSCGGRGGQAWYQAAFGVTNLTYNPARNGGFNVTANWSVSARVSRGVTGAGPRVRAELTAFVQVWDENTSQVYQAAVPLLRTHAYGAASGVARRSLDRDAVTVALLGAAGGVPGRARQVYLISVYLEVFVRASGGSHVGPGTRAWAAVVVTAGRLRSVEVG